LPQYRFAQCIFLDQFRTSFHLQMSYGQYRYES